MKPGLVRGLLVCVAGMQASCIFLLLFLPFARSFAPVGKAGYGDFPTMDYSAASVALVSSAVAFLIAMTVQKRFRTDPMAAWVLPALFVLGIAICTTAGWLVFLWADDIAAFFSPLSAAR